MKALHINAYFAGSTVYRNLFQALHNVAVEQSVYAPIRSSAELRKNDLSQVNVKYDLCLTKTDRFFFSKKTYKLFSRVQNYFKISDFDFIHAHTLFTDGAVAYKLHQKYGIPYLIAIRNTDLNIFHRFFIHLRPLARKILLNAERVVFLNHEYKSRVLNFYSFNGLDDKSIIIPNGIDASWFSNPAPPKMIDSINLSFLYVGDYSPNKSVPLMINLLKEFAINNPNFQLTLTLIGGGPARGRKGIDKKIKNELAKETPMNFIIYEKGRISNFDQIRAEYRNASFFIMLSKRETFGLVYAEAMSQATPAIYTKGEGIAPYFSDFEVGFSLEPGASVGQVFQEKLMYAISRYDDLSAQALSVVSRFDWNKIALKYLDIYSLILRKS